MDKGGEWIVGSQVPLDQPWRGLPKLLHMVVPAIRECLAHIGNVRPEMIPLLLCVAEKDRPGRLEGLDDRLFSDVQTELGVRFHPRSSVIPHGRVAGGLAMLQACKLLHEERLPFCVIAGVDSYLVASTLAAYEEKSRLLTSQNSNGFIPGEAGAAVLVGAQSSMAFSVLALAPARKKPRLTRKNHFAPTGWCKPSRLPWPTPARRWPTWTTASLTRTASNTGSRKPPWL